MAIASSITTALASLEAQVLAAEPLINANHSTIVALQLNAVNLVNSIQSALVTTGLLDNWVSPADPISIINGVLNLLTLAQDQNKLSLMRGVVGRATSNLDQL